MGYETTTLFVEFVYKQLDIWLLIMSSKLYCSINNTNNTTMEYLNQWLAIKYDFNVKYSGSIDNTRQMKG